MKEKVKVESCCCGCSLRTGTTIIGVLQTVSAIIMLILTYATNVQWQVAVVNANPDTVKIIYTICLCIVAIVAALLLVGVSKVNSVYMLPWLVLGVLQILFTVVNTIMTCIIFFLYQSATFGVGFLFGGLIGIMIYMYLWIVVYSYYLEVKNEKMNIEIVRHETLPNYRAA